MIWFLEKHDSVVVCEIRRTDDESAFEFEIADATGPTTHRFVSPTDLIAKYLNEQARLIADGWLPRGHIETAE